MNVNNSNKVNPNVNISKGGNNLPVEKKDTKFGDHKITENEGNKEFKNNIKASQEGGEKGVGLGERKASSGFFAFLAAPFRALIRFIEKKLALSEAGTKIDKLFQELKEVEGKDKQEVAREVIAKLIEITGPIKSDFYGEDLSKLEQLEQKLIGKAREFAGLDKLDEVKGYYEDFKKNISDNDKYVPYDSAVNAVQWIQKFNKDNITELEKKELVAILKGVDKKMPSLNIPAASVPSWIKEQLEILEPKVQGTEEVPVNEQIEGFKKELGKFEVYFRNDVLLDLEGKMTDLNVLLGDITKAFVGKINDGKFSEEELKQVQPFIKELVKDLRVFSKKLGKVGENQKAVDLNKEAESWASY